MKLPVISLSGKQLASFDEAIKKEWLVTNGLGGYASSTILGVNTRKYHGLLVAALHPPGNRTVCLAKLDEDILVGNEVYRLGVNEFQHDVFPQGYVFLNEFSVSPFPKFVYRAQNVEVGKTIFMPTGKNATAVVYRVVNENCADVKIRVYPLLNCRHFHTVVDRLRKTLDMKQQQGDREVETTFTNKNTTIKMRTTEGKFIEKSTWVDRLYYREDGMRGESSIDDCYQPGYFETTVPPKREKEFAITTAVGTSSQEATETLAFLGPSTGDVSNHLEREARQLRDSLMKFYNSHELLVRTDWLSWILLAAEAFIVKNARNQTAVIAGYHWYEAWGRDTFISLPGLMLVTGKFEEAKRTLSFFNQHCVNGLIPNFIADKSDKSAYNSVDATLWYINSVLQYLKYTRDFRFVKQNLWKNLKLIVEKHEEGTDFGIHLDDDGLLAHGPRLTWMDAEVEGNAMTPRKGKAVEIQALWYNALRTMQFLARQFEEKNLFEHYAGLAVKAQENFNRKFWNPEKNCLFDVLGETGIDASLRPNQIIAASLDHPILYQDKAQSVINIVQRELLTPCGLRTLSRDDPLYRGTYFGDRNKRDQAYHNGTVWPWLLGPFTKAFLKTEGCSDHKREFAFMNLILPVFSRQIDQSGLGTVNEIFDGDSPHEPRGCISQAWSVAEPLRAYVEDVMQVRPKYEREIVQS